MTLHGWVESAATVMSEFCGVYYEKYAAKYGMFRLERIRDMGERFLTCGDYRLEVARIRCTNPNCGHGYFRPFSCKGFYLCPSCSQKQTLLFAEVSRLIYTIISEFYNAAAGKPLLSGLIAAHQTFGDQLRWNPHHHCLVSPAAHLAAGGQGATRRGLRAESPVLEELVLR